MPVSAVPRASARGRVADRCRGAFGRWRCRWIAHPLVELEGRRVVGIGRRSSRCRLSPGGWWSARCWVVRGERAGARRRVTIGWRRARTRSSATCSGSGTRSARRGYATSIGQLVAGLAPVMGWGPVPRDRAERARFVRAHRRSVQRWLDDLQAAGLVAHEPERDGDGLWWRTQIVLLPRPGPDRGGAARSQRAARAGGVRASVRAGGAAGWRRAWAAIRGRSAAPSRASVVRGSCASATSAVHERAPARSGGGADRRRRVALRSGCRDLTHPFGAPPTSAPSPVSPRRSRRSETSRVEGPAARWPARAVSENGTVAAETGARGRAASLDRRRRRRPRERRAPRRRSPFRARPSTPWWHGAWPLVSSALAARTRCCAPQVAARVAEVLAWPSGRRCPLGRLREAWVAQRYGLAIVVESGTAAAGVVAPGLRRVGRARDRAL